MELGNDNEGESRESAQYSLVYLECAGRGKAMAWWITSKNSSVR